MNTLGSAKNIEDTMVVVGMSGGVDSSVTAYLLKEQGYKVVGLFMKNWEELDESGVCQSSKEFADVVKVCEQLDIPYYSVDFVEEYRERVFQTFLDDYAKGLTPNPDILCNREIKFDVFFKYARGLGADFLATGHYCQNKVIGGRHRLVKGVDPGKDQSYFLHAISEEVLPHVLFPIGHLEKAEVRNLAMKAGLATKEKKDSTGICFIGERNFRPFLSQYLAPKKGPFVSLDGESVGEHDGAQFYTIGQRKGLGLGGQGEPWFVVDKKMESNEVIVVRGERHPRLFADELWAIDLNWINLDGQQVAQQASKLFAKTRYRQPDQGVSRGNFSSEQWHLVFDHPQRALTPRQSLVMYCEMEGEMVCLGGAMIDRLGASYYERNIELPATLGD
jgi:tRNA-uridine 2-sulfurtransferase